MSGLQPVIVGVFRGARSPHCNWLGSDLQRFASVESSSTSPPIRPTRRSTVASFTGTHRLMLPRLPSLRIPQVHSLSPPGSQPELSRWSSTLRVGIDEHRPLAAGVRCHAELCQVLAVGRRRDARDAGARQRRVGWKDLRYVVDCRAVGRRAQVAVEDAVDLRRAEVHDLRHEIQPRLFCAVWRSS
jgi:hypothetical protein